MRLSPDPVRNREQVTQLAINSFEGSFLDDADKAARIAEVKAYAAA